MLERGISESVFEIDRTAAGVVAWTLTGIVASLPSGLITMTSIPSRAYVLRYIVSDVPDASRNSTELAGFEEAAKPAANPCPMPKTWLISALLFAVGWAGSLAGAAKSVVAISSLPNCFSVGLEERRICVA